MPSSSSSSSSSPSFSSSPSISCEHELQVLNPATEEVVATDPAATPEDVHAAVVRATEAQAGWSALAPGTPSATPAEYGLSGSIWTRDVGRALRVAQAVRAGNLSANSHASVRYWTPFGGYKQSGLGRELGRALTAFTETKNVFISTEGPAQ